MTQRQKSISEDYEKTNKKNVFKDRCGFAIPIIPSRFGAADTLQAMTEEEKMLKKLEIQRKKQLKKQKFALPDDEEETLTHGGKTLNCAVRFIASCVVEDDFKKLHEDIDMDEEEPELDPELFLRADVRKMQEENRDRPRTQKEIMMEVAAILRSKCVDHREEQGVPRGAQARGGRSVEPDRERGCDDGRAALAAVLQQEGRVEARGGGAVGGGRGVRPADGAAGARGEGQGERPSEDAGGAWA